jgi:valyl-tRNA synthetase
MYTYVCRYCDTEFDVLGESGDLPKAAPFSKRFEAGKNFCNKLWNAARFALMNLGELSFAPLKPEDLASEDRWILSRLTRTIGVVNSQLEAYNASAAVTAARDFFWGDMCDWYLELIKPRMKEDADPASRQAARQVLATVLDQVLRLFHPFTPFITEVIWKQLGAQAAERGIDAPLPSSELCITAAWPTANAAWVDEGIESDYDLLQQVVREIRNVRQTYNVPPKEQKPAAITGTGAALETLRGLAHHVQTLAGLSGIELGEGVSPPANSGTAAVGELKLFVGEILDPVKERARLEKQRDKLEKQIAGSEKKLSNEKFKANAPEAWAKAQAGQEKQLAELESVKQSLADLG